MDSPVSTCHPKGKPLGFHMVGLKHSVYTKPTTMIDSQLFLEIKWAHKMLREFFFKKKSKIPIVVVGGSILHLSMCTTRRKHLLVN